MARNRLMNRMPTKRLSVFRLLPPGSIRMPLPAVCVPLAVMPKSRKNIGLVVETLNPFCVVLLREILDSVCP